MDNRLQILIKNLLDQTAYTPQAQQYIKNLPVEISPLGGASLGMYGYDDSPADAGILVSPKLLQTNTSLPANPIEVLRHEIDHSMDSNVNLYNSPVQTDTSNFLQKLIQLGTTPAASNTRSFVSQYPPAQQNREAFAQYGAQGQNVLLSNPQLADYFSKIYVPESKQMNYSPVYKMP